MEMRETIYSVGGMTSRRNIYGKPQAQATHFDRNLNHLHHHPNTAEKFE